MEKFKAGTYVKQSGYKSFEPNKINRRWLVSNPQVINLLSKADRFLGRLDMYSEYVNIDLFVRMHIAKEATQSTRIEGTQTNMEEAFRLTNSCQISKSLLMMKVMNCRIC